MRLTSNERNTLQQIIKGWAPGKRRDREKLASKGMLTSHIGSRCYVTALGYASFHQPTQKESEGR